MSLDKESNIKQLQKAINTTNQQYTSQAPESDTDKLIAALKAEHTAFERHNSLFFQKESKGAENPGKETQKSYRPS